MFFTPAADQMRAFIRDKLGFPFTDTGGGWLIFDAPEAEIGCHEAQTTFHRLSFYCDEMNFNFTYDMATLDALKLAGEENMKGKILIDVANPLEFSKGMPPTLSVSNTDSLGEQIQRAFPDVKVVKSLNTMNCKLMVNPSLVRGDHDVFVSGNDQTAKSRVTEILKNWFGWKSVVDLGDIGSARGAEQLLPLWVRLVGALGTANFNLKIVK